MSASLPSTRHAIHSLPHKHTALLLRPQLNMYGGASNVSTRFVQQKLASARHQKHILSQSPSSAHLHLQATNPMLAQAVLPGRVEPLKAASIGSRYVAAALLLAGLMVGNGDVKTAGSGSRTEEKQKMRWKVFGKGGGAVKRGLKLRW